MNKILNLIGKHNNVGDLVILSFSTEDNITFDLMTSVSEYEELGLKDIKQVSINNEKLDFDVPLLSVNDLNNDIPLLVEDHELIEHVTLLCDTHNSEMIKNPII